MEKMMVKSNGMIYRNDNNNDLNMGDSKSIVYKISNIYSI